MKKILPFFLLLFYQSTISQTIVKMRNMGGVSVIPCKINGISFDFIFDTGASDVTLSYEIAVELWNKGYIKKEDILGSSTYQVASGDLVEGIVINLRKIEIGGIEINNVKASILKGGDVPLLLGQSAISRLGLIQLDLNNNTIVIQNTTIPTTQSTKYNSTVGVLIGTQEWMINNLDVTHFNNGDLIPEAKTKEDWARAGREGKPVWCYFNNDPKNNVKGKLYNWYAINDPRGLAPAGWEVATELDWDQLEVHLIKGYGHAPFSHIANQLKQYNFDFISIGTRIANNNYDFSSGAVIDNKWWVKSTKSKTLFNVSKMIAWNSGNKYFISMSGMRSLGMPVKCIRK